MNLRLLALACLCVSLSLAGCGGSSGGDDQAPESEEEAVVAVAVEYAEAEANQDGEKMCQVLSPELLEAYDRDDQDCATTWNGLLDSVSEQDAAMVEARRAKLTVDDVIIEGNTATLAPQVNFGVGLVKIDGEWKVNFSG